MQNFIRRIHSAMPEWMLRNPLSLLLTIRIGGLIVAALAMAAFAVITDEVWEKETQAFDAWVISTLMLLRTPLLDQVTIGLSAVGQPSVLLALSVGLGIWLLLKRHRQEAITLAIAGSGALALNVLIKHLFHRQRPPAWEHAVAVNQYSFPSGHAMMSMVVYGMICYLLARHFPRWRQWIIAGTILLIAAIGFSRLYLGVHWPTDVAAGYAAGLIWLISCIFSLELWHQHHLAQHNVSQESPEESRRY